MKEKIKNLIYEQVRDGKCYINGTPFSKYQKCYLNTNEKISGYINTIQGKKRALTVLASGDHLLNLINKGIKEIDTFDTNLLTKYYVFGLKFAMIRKYDYKDYLTTYKKLIDKNTSLEEITSILNDLLKYMDNLYKNFWEYIIEYNYKIQKNNINSLNLFEMLFICFNNLEKNINNNLYLAGKEEYKKTRELIKKAKITFKNEDALILDRLYNDTYDVCMLSNILDYFGNFYRRNNKIFNYKELDDYKNRILNLIDKDGILFLKYIFNYGVKDSYAKKVFITSDISTSEFTNETIISIDKDTIKDGMILVKKSN